MKRIGGLKQQVGAGLQRAHASTAARRSSRSPSAYARDPRRSSSASAQLLDELLRPSCARARRPARAVRGARPRRAGVRCASTTCATSSRWSRRRRWTRRTRSRSSRTCRSTCWSTLRYPKDAEPLLARVKVPVGGGIPRFVRVGDARTFVPLEDVMANNLDLLFPGMEIEALRAVPRHAQREHRARRGRGRRSARDDRVRAARAPVRADRAPRGRHGHGRRSSAACSPPSSASTSRPTSFEVDGHARRCAT